MAGYGEQVLWVIGVLEGILAFGGVFSVVQSEPLYGIPVEYLVLTSQSFITLVLRGVEDAEGPWNQLLAQVESFVGILPIALFVFTLTRSIHR